MNAETRTHVVSDRDVPEHLRDGEKSQWRSSGQFDWAEMQISSEQVDRIAKVAFGVFLLFMIGLTALGGVLLYFFVTIVLAILAKIVGLFRSTGSRV